MVSEHPDGIGHKLQSVGIDSYCGLRPEPGVLCATKHRVTENNSRNFGGLQLIMEYPGSKAVPQKIHNESDPEATVSLCSLLNNAEFIIVLNYLLNLQLSKVSLYFRESSLLPQQTSMRVGEWNSSFLKFNSFLGIFFNLGMTLSLFHLVRNNLETYNDTTAFFSYSRPKKK